MHVINPNFGAASGSSPTKTIDRKAIADQLLQIADLQELATGDDAAPNRLREFASIVRAGSEISDAAMTMEEVLAMDCGDPTTQSLVMELLEQTDPQVYAQFSKGIPESILAMLHLPGLGPKRLHTVWKEMGIMDQAALYHAATENRLVHQKGFGPKTQEKVLQSLAYVRVNASSFTLNDLRPFAVRLENELRAMLGPAAKFEFIGDYRRGMPVCNGLEMMVEPDHYRAVLLHLIKTADYEILTASSDMLLGKPKGTEIPLTFQFKGVNFYLELFRRSGSKDHVDLIPVDERHFYRSEAEIYEEAGLPWMPPAVREGKEEVKLALGKKLPKLIEKTDIQGLLHVHSTASDGSDSLEKLAAGCKDMGMQYLGISDHGPQHQGRCLTKETIVSQHREIDRLNQRMAPFRILKGVEAEILPDGSLGMTDGELSAFDFVIASMHVTTELSRAEATMRLIKAIRNPYTTILGHATGKMVFGEHGQPIDIEAIVDACAVHDVAIELNCHPARMDLDWKWIRLAVAQGVRIAINPNAHQIAALNDYEVGVTVARKGLVSKALALNALNLEEMEAWLAHRRMQAMQ